MITTTSRAVDAVGLDPTGIRRLAAESQRRAGTKREVREAVVHELDMLRKREYRARETLGQIEREIGNLKGWLERQREGAQEP
jgi:hypothetical protein